ncbi:MAG: glucose-6-phosphate isomerase [Robiginitomaculum sp.]|nr:MAG: glucose-6-phosphate isomerase [Robiginitomaculum sp.]
MSEKTIINTLSKLAATPSSSSLIRLFDDEPSRLQRLSIQAPGLYADFSKQKVDEKSLNALLAYAEARNLGGFFAAMRAGEVVNPTEHRAAQHMALRAPKGENFTALGTNISETVANERARMRAFADDIRNGKRQGVTGRAIRTLVHIGIGGSDLGPRLLMQALKRYHAPGIDLRFAANLDAADINDALSGCDPEATLVIVVSKSFSTAETLANAQVARAWLVQHLGEDAPTLHMAAVSTNLAATADFGITDDNVFAMHDWVGGRYSLWSSVGLSVMAALKEGAFEDMLAGAAAMDAHALTTPVAQNAPLLSGLIQFWNRNFLHMQSRAIVPYAARLALLPSYLQQLIMESNGKSVRADGTPADLVASPVIFGAEGTNAQHAFFQQLHQGPDPASVDFIGFIADQEHNPGHHHGVLANMLAQSRALMGGSPAPKDAPHKNFTGNRPSTTLLMDALSPFSLGALLAFYEHETVTQAVLCGINPFDQWGVELGKHVALEVLSHLEKNTTQGMDASTAALIKRITHPR